MNKQEIANFNAAVEAGVKQAEKMLKIMANRKERRTNAQWKK